MKIEVVEPKLNGPGGVVATFAALLLVAACMVVSYFYPYPSGKRPDLLSLIASWGREALIVVAAVSLLVVLATTAAIEVVRKLREPGA